MQWSNVAARRGGLRPAKLLLSFACSPRARKWSPASLVYALSQLILLSVLVKYLCSRGNHAASKLVMTADAMSSLAPRQGRPSLFSASACYPVPLRACRRTPARPRSCREVQPQPGAALELPSETGSRLSDAAKPAASNDHRVAIFVRFYPKLDLPYLEAFLDHHRRLGFDRIIALQTGPECPGFEEIVEKYRAKGFLETHYPRGIEAIDVESVFNAHSTLAFNPNNDWVLRMDPDEFVLIDSRFPTIQDFIREKEAQFGRLDVIQFRWAMMEHLQARCPTVPVLNLLSSLPVWWNPHMKTMVRPTSVTDGAQWPNPHFPFLKQGSRVWYGGSETLNHSEIFAFYTDKAGHPAPDQDYQEHALFHLHTRSLVNILTKALWPADDGLEIKGYEALKKLVDGQMLPTYQVFTEMIGRKAVLPITHSGCLLEDFRHCKPQAARVPPANLSHLLPPQERRSTVPACSQKEEDVMGQQALDPAGIKLSGTTEVFEAIARDVNYLIRLCCPDVNV